MKTLNAPIAILATLSLFATPAFSATATGTSPNTASPTASSPVGTSAPLSNGSTDANVVGSGPTDSYSNSSSADGIRRPASVTEQEEKDNDSPAMNDINGGSYEYQQEQIFDQPVDPRVDDQTAPLPGAYPSPYDSPTNSSNPADAPSAK